MKPALPKCLGVPYGVVHNPFLQEDVGGANDEDLVAGAQAGDPPAVSIRPLQNSDIVSRGADGQLTAIPASRRKRQGQNPAVPYNRFHSTPCPIVGRVQGADSKRPPGASH